MNSKYEIFKQRSDGSFVRIEAAKDIEQARRDLKNLVSSVPGDYRLWDSATHKFINSSKH
jgi:hypothetical protein